MQIMDESNESLLSSGSSFITDADTWDKILTPLLIKTKNLLLHPRSTYVYCAIYSLFCVIDIWSIIHDAASHSNLLYYIMSLFQNIITMVMPPVSLYFLHLIFLDQHIKYIIKKALFRFPKFNSDIKFINAINVTLLLTGCLAELVINPKRVML